MNHEAVMQAKAAAKSANDAYGLMMTEDGSVRRDNGAAGVGLLSLAKAVEQLALAVAALAQE